ncbi:hypothetical protein [Singulisphaera acidiphila]|uniref:Carboxypeptidase regulatory-like domain-containing protein n=1 Tax=Singulisphaera acidiphila (strain ATCC BAA-1392 / DSM 18658 / VKM B-2454 / MOB10) TaxID=886293 RepID=L0D5M0_SINAD|nr:hypothetical protein [Singulisphaera acidiphila]AGA24557.1 hypothetical protein Sinac_0096 [Singulisphaera acidiphila DSM 18658]
MRRRRFLDGLAVAAAAVLMTTLAGCASGEAPGMTTLDEAQVKGTVKVRGKLLDGGTLHFNPSNAKRVVGARDTTIAKDGSFIVKTLLGQNVVTVTPKTRSKAFYGLEYEEKTVEIKPGENAIDIEFIP